MEKVEHIGIAVKDLEQAKSTYSKLLNTKCYKTEKVPKEGVETAFFKTGPNKIELLGSTDPAGPVAKFLEKKGEGIHHIAFKVENILAEMDRLKDEGFAILGEEPRKGADNKLVIFLHPKSSNGVLLELCQEIVE